MSGERRAALALHGLTARDRESILAELDAGQQEVLRAHLAELTELGFAPDAHAVLPPAASSAPPAGKAEAPATPRQALASAQAADMLALLANEPASLVGKLLAAGPWPWTDAFLGALAPVRRVAVAGVMTACGAAPARERALIELTALALSRQEKAPVTRPVSVVSAFFTRIKAWKR